MSLNGDFPYWYRANPYYGCPHCAPRCPCCGRLLGAHPWWGVQPQITWTTSGLGLDAGNASSHTDSPVCDGDCKPPA